MNEVKIHVKSEDHTDMNLIGRKVEAKAKTSFLKVGAHSGAAFAAGFIKTITLGMVGSGFAQAGMKMAPQMAHLGGALGVTMAAALAVKLATALNALLPAALGGALVAGPLIYLWKTQEKAVDRLKKKAQTFMDVISRPLKIPFEKSLGAIEDSLGRMAKPLSKMFREIGKGLEPLTKGAMKGVEGFIGAIAPKADSIAASFKAWGNALPRIGKALGRMLSNWIGDADETQASVDDLAGSFVDLADAVGSIGKGFRKFNKINDAFKNMIDEQRAMILKWRIAVLKGLISVADAWGKISPEGRKVAASLRKSLSTARHDFEKTTNAINRRKIEPKIKADISELQAKVRNAKQRLRETHNQKTQAKIRAEINQLRAQVAAAKRALASIHDKKVRIIVTRTNAPGYGIKGPGVATGGFIGGRSASHAAEGGPRGGQTWVGEQGPELVDLPLGSHVNSNPDSMQQMSRGGRGGGPHLHFHFDRYTGSTTDLVRDLVNAKKRGQLDVLFR